MSEKFQPEVGGGADGGGGTGDAAEPRYNIPFSSDCLPQVEPISGAWLRCQVLRPPTLQEVRDEVVRLGGEKPFPSAAAEKQEFDELVGLYRENAGDEPPGASTSRLLSHPLFYQPPPAGAVLSGDLARGTPMGGERRLTGPELASLFEVETPGLWHRHVLNVLLAPDPAIGMSSPAIVLSPPRQALFWAALDVAIYAALSAAWNYKWIAEGLARVDYRRRPSEYAKKQNVPHAKFQVLYDLERIQRNGRIFRDPLRRRPIAPNCKGDGFSPGTPRHPAYPSGHSTYSAAASRILGCLFDGYRDPRLGNAFDISAEFNKLADDIGVARLHGGVHWRSDHAFGQRVGNAVGNLVIAQLNASGIKVPSGRVEDPPPMGTIQNQAVAFGQACGQGNANFCEAVIRETTDGNIQQNVPL
jgi:hypothetical protein